VCMNGEAVYIIYPFLCAAWCLLRTLCPVACLRELEPDGFVGLTGTIAGACMALFRK